MGPDPNDPDVEDLDEDGEFNASLANDLWPGLGPVLRAALDEVQTGNGPALPASFGIRRQSQSSGMMSDGN